MHARHPTQSPLLTRQVKAAPLFRGTMYRVAVRLSVWTIVATLCVCPDAVLAQRVRPEQVAVVTAKGNAESTELAEYYCQQRGIDANRIVALEFPEGDELDRQVWEDQLRPQIQGWLEQNDPDQKVTHFVTTFGVPLAISAWADASSNPDSNNWSAFYDSMLTHHLASLNVSVSQVAGLASVDFEPFGKELSTQEMGRRFDEIAGLAQNAIAASPPTDREAANQTLQNDVRAVAGLVPFINGIKSRMESGQGVSQTMIAQYERAIGMQDGYEKSLGAIDRSPVSFDREISISRVVKLNAGHLAVVEWIRKQAELVRRNESMASFDSELCLVRISDYRRAGGYPLPDREEATLPGREPVFAVTRIDGPAAELAKALIDRATIVADPEFRYSGKVYIDKRGLPESARPTDLKIEYWLERMATRFGSSPNLEVIKDERPVLFEEGKCPETALYLGWYGLGNFRDSFTFVPGATAYHLVPVDALGVHDPEDTGWCKNFIENGATFVVGTVTDPIAITLEEDGGSSSQLVLPRRSNASDGSVIFGDFLYANP